MEVSTDAGKPAKPEMLVNVPKVVSTEQNLLRAEFSGKATGNEAIVKTSDYEVQLPGKLFITYTRRL